MAGPRITVACKLPNGLNLGFVTLNGSLHASEVGGYGLTTVDADKWDAWLKDHAGLPAVKKGLVFSNTKRADVAAQAIEQAELRTGFEQLDPEKPAAGVEETDEGKAARNKVAGKRAEKREAEREALQDE